MLVVILTIRIVWIGGGMVILETGMETTMEDTGGEKGQETGEEAGEETGKDTLQETIEVVPFASRIKGMTFTFILKVVRTMLSTKI